MALTKCKECGHQVSKQAKTCPQCGAPLKKERQQQGCGTLILVIVLGGVFMNIFTDDYSTGTSNSSGQANESGSDGSGTDTSTETQFAHSRINVRKGPGKSHDVVGQVNRGDQVTLKEGASEWAVIQSGPQEGNYIYKPVLEDQPLPPLEIASWNWRADSTHGTDGSVIWNVEVRNNTGSYIDSAKVKFSTYDGSGNVITSDFTFVQGLAPGKTSSSKGYATYYGNEEKARIQIAR